MRIALHFASQQMPPHAVRVAQGICQGLAEGGRQPKVLVAQPVSVPECTTLACDPAITAPWTAQWEPGWRLPLGLRPRLYGEALDALICPGEFRDLATARLALGYQTDTALVSWSARMDDEDARYAQYADLHLVSALALAQRIAAAGPPSRPVALVPRPVPSLQALKRPRAGVRIVWIGRQDAGGGLDLLLDALRLLPSSWSLTVAPIAAPEDGASPSQSPDPRCTVLAPHPDPWQQISEASLAVVTSDRPSEADAIAESASRSLPVLAVPGANGSRDLLRGDPELPEEPSLLAASLLAAERKGLQEIVRAQAQRAKGARRQAASLVAEALSVLGPMRERRSPS